MPKSSEHDAALTEDDVGRLDVAVHDLLGMHVGQRLAQLAHVLERLGGRQRATLLEDAGQARPADQLGHQATPVLG